MEPLAMATAGVVAPAWLHESLGVLVQAAPGVRILTSATTVEALLSTHVDEPPDLVLLYAATNHAARQVGKLESVWPDAYSIVLVEQAVQQAVAQKAGADEVLLGGLAPERLLKALDRFCVSADPNPSGHSAL